jgi:hypothetical protein
MLRGNYAEFSLRLIKEKYAELAHDHEHLTPLASALEWWESKLISAKQVRKWTRDELCQKIDEYKERLTALETK